MMYPPQTIHDLAIFYLLSKDEYFLKDEKLEKMKYLKGSKRIERVKPMVKNTFSQKEILHFQIIWTGLLEQCLQANQL